MSLVCPNLFRRLEEGNMATCTETAERSEANLELREIRRVYLITYSRADTRKVPSRQRFAEIVLDAFELRGASVIQWACCKERHTTGGVHLHMAIKLSKPQRWLSIRQFIQTRHGINVHFSSRHVNYFTAWQYVTKEDDDVLLSPNHPDLWNTGPPATQAASERVAEERRERQEQEIEEGASGEESSSTSSPSVSKKRKRTPRLSMFEVSEIAVSKGINTYTELLALAQRQKREGKTDLAEFIVNRGKKTVEEAIRTGWEMEKSEDTLRRERMSRMEILQEALTGNCAENCNGRWLHIALNILQRNSIARNDFSSAIRELLQKGRGKYRNIFLKGPANCGKTFLLNPLTVIYKTFLNPASTTFAWVGAESAEIIFLNDFRWSAQVLPWQDMLLLLEGQPVHFSAPKTHYAQDITFEKDTPIFCTSKSEIISIKGGVVDDIETQMMHVRWRVFNMYAQVPESEQIILSPCGKCFARLVLE